MKKESIYPPRVQGLEGDKLGQIWPDKDTFLQLATEQRVVPVVIRLLADQDTPISLYRKLTSHTGTKNTFLLESLGNAEDSRWSIIGVNAPATLSEKAGQVLWSGEIPSGVPTTGDPLVALAKTAEAFKSKRFSNLPPFTGGLVGFISYDAVRRLEKLGPKPPDEIGVPELCMLLATDVAIYDHKDSTVLLVSNALNLNASADGAEAAYEKALNSIDSMRRALRTQIDTNPIIYTPSSAENALARTEAAEFEASVKTAIRNIYEGEIFQVVPSQRFTQSTNCDPLDIYRVLRRLNPSPYMFLLRAHDSDDNPIDVVGASPETLLTVRATEVITHPIAGSRPRGASAFLDEKIEQELLQDEKDRSEHLMLVDLSRNDLQKVCKPGSVVVRDFMEVVKYSHIMHLVSTVTGELQEDKNAFDAFKAAFPAGTLSGAPKPRAMQIIDELEPVARGIYGGCVGYLDFAGDMDMAIAIRTTVIKDLKAHVQAGAGVVADSDPTMEHREAVSKAAAAQRAVASAASIESQ